MNGSICFAENVYELNHLKAFTSLMNIFELFNCLAAVQIVLKDIDQYFIVSFLNEFGYTH